MRPIFILLTFLVPLVAQQPPAPAAVYLVVYTLHETAAGEQAKTRQYSVLLEPKAWGRIRSGTKVPYLAEKDKYSYAEIGVNIDCRLQEMGDQVSLNAKVEISSVLAPGNLPRIQNMRSESDALIALNKATQITSVDDGSRHYAVDVTVTRP